jgi:tRNA (cytidine56-2'-O)-methyltransferase
LTIDRSIRVLRVGERYVRDDRTLTHLCLVSRALGAEAIYLGEVEKDITGTLKKVNEDWGGSFEVIPGANWRKVIEAARSEGRAVLHLTMYGLPLQEKIEELRTVPRLLIVVGGPKVPGRVYHSADYNIAVTSQPHSEIAALAITLHEVQSGEELKRSFEKSRMRIVPKARGKHVVRN